MISLRDTRPGQEIAVLLRSKRVESKLSLPFFHYAEPSRFGFATRITNEKNDQKAVLFVGTLGRSRTCNLFLRTELLYPIELPRRLFIISLASKPLGCDFVAVDFVFAEPVANFFFGLF